MLCFKPQIFKIFSVLLAYVLQNFQIRSSSTSMSIAFFAECLVIAFFAECLVILHYVLQNT